MSNTLKPVSIYVEVDVKDELPEIGDEVTIIGSKYGKGEIEATYQGWRNEDETTWSYINEHRTQKDFTGDGQYWLVTHWLKPIPERYVFTKDELKKILGDAFDAGEKKR